MEPTKPDARSSSLHYLDQPNDHGVRGWAHDGKKHGNPGRVR